MGAHYGYQEIAEQLRRRIESGALPTGGRVPGEEALADEFGVARGTARLALQRLESSGLIHVVTGRGRFVAGETHDEEPSTSYERVAAHVRSLIKRGRLTPNASLPSENDLRIELCVSRNTVRRAYELLEAEGLVVRRQGAGAFVADVKG